MLPPRPAPLGVVVAVHGQQLWSIPAGVVWIGAMCFYSSGCSLENGLFGTSVGWFLSEMAVVSIYFQ